MHFDECAEARAVNIIDLLQINDHPCGAGCQEIVDHGKQPAALFSQHKTPFERQKVDSIRLTLRYFQGHRSLPPRTIQRPSRVFASASMITSLLATHHFLITRPSSTPSDFREAPLPPSPIPPHAHPSFRTQQADCFLRIRSSECVGPPRAKSLFSHF